MSKDFSQHDRLYEIFCDYEEHSGRELNYTHQLSKFSTRIGEMLNPKNPEYARRWPGFTKKNLIKGWDGKWRTYRLVRPEPRQGVLLPFSSINNL